MADQVKTINWRFEAVTADGKHKKGKVAAESYEAALATLEGRGMTVIEVMSAGSVLDMEIMASKENRPPKFKLEEAEAFARQLYGMVDAGVAVSEALELIGMESDNPAHKKMYSVLADRVMSGTTLSAAMEEYPGCFDEVFISYIRSGERTGDLPATTKQLSESLGKQTSVKNKIKAVTAYPKMMGGAIIAITIGILMFLVPVYAEIYAGYGAQLPAPTRAVVAASGIIAPLHIEFSSRAPFITDLIPGDHTLFTAPINFLSPIFWGAAIFFGWRSFRKNTADNRILNAKIDKAKFSIPVMGKLWKSNMLYRWSATFAGSLTAGLSTQESLDVAAGASGSDWMRLATDDLREAVNQGKALSARMKEHPALFSNTTVGMTATGEKTGEMARMHQNRARSIDSEVEVITANLGARMEVALLLVMGLVVGTILVALYLPIFGLSDTIGQSYTESTPTP